MSKNGRIDKNNRERQPDQLPAADSRPIFLAEVISVEEIIEETIRRPDGSVFRRKRTVRPVVLEDAVDGTGRKSTRAHGDSILPSWIRNLPTVAIGALGGLMVAFFGWSYITGDTVKMGPLGEWGFERGATPAGPVIPQGGRALKTYGAQACLFDHAVLASGDAFAIEKSLWMVGRTSADTPPRRATLYVVMQGNVVTSPITYEVIESGTYPARIAGQDLQITVDRIAAGSVTLSIYRQDSPWGKT